MCQLCPFELRRLLHADHTQRTRSKLSQPAPVTKTISGQQVYTQVYTQVCMSLACPDPPHHNALEQYQPCPFPNPRTSSPLSLSFPPLLSPVSPQPPPQLPRPPPTHLRPPRCWDPRWRKGLQQQQRQRLVRPSSDAPGISPFRSPPQKQQWGVPGVREAASAGREAAVAVGTTQGASAQAALAVVARPGGASWASLIAGREAGRPTHSRPCLSPCRGSR